MTKFPNIFTVNNVQLQNCDISAPKAVKKGIDPSNHQLVVKPSKEILLHEYENVNEETNTRTFKKIQIDRKILTSRDQENRWV